MVKKLMVPTAAMAGLLMTLGAAQAQDAPPRGIIASGPPVDIFLEITTSPDGGPVVSATEFRLETGGYYRLNVVCPDAMDDATGFHWESDGLVENSHIRVLSVSDMELYLQGATFRAIQCDEAGAMRFSFHPMRSGTYDFLVRGGPADPPLDPVIGQFIVEPGAM